MSDHVSDLQWDRLLADELPAEAAEIVRAHAEHCAACSTRLRELIAQRDELRFAMPSLDALFAKPTPTLVQPIDQVLPANPAALYLLIASADGRWTARPLPASGAITIGRGVEVDVHLDESSVSRRHARLEVADTGELRLIDLNSSNGTRVGGRLVRDIAVAVRPDEPIMIGRTVLAIHASPSSTSAPLRDLGTGLAMTSVDALVARAAPTLHNVLIVGESGVGKGFVASRIHRLSTRAGGPLVQLNCAGLSPTLLESALFGHERGAFPGAETAGRGLLAAASGGTVVLDEIGEIPMDVQYKLLVAIEQRDIWALGSNRSESIDVRIICTAHRDLEAEIRRGRFRADLYYRITEFVIRIPPLRERRDEIEGLVLQLASDAARHLKRDRPPTFDEDALATLHRYHWPGNIRQLRHIVEQAVILAKGDTVTWRMLGETGLPNTMSLPRPDRSAEVAERNSLIQLLATHGGNQTRAAATLGVARNTIRARMRRYSIPFPRKAKSSKGNPSKGNPS